MTPLIKNVEVLDDYRLLIIYENDEKKVYDMKPNFKYDIYKKLKDYEVFKKVRAIGETIEWETGEDIAPESLYNDSENI